MSLTQQHIEPWTQLPDEGQKAYAAFVIYLHAGINRSTAKVGRECGRSGKLIQRWCTDFKWVSRVQAYSDHMEAARVEAEEKALGNITLKWAARQDELREKEYATGTALIAKAEEMLKFPLAKRTVRQGPNGEEIHLHPTRWSMEAAVRFFQAGSQLIRLSLGLSNETVKMTGGTDSKVAIDTDLTDKDIAESLAAIARRFNITKQPRPEAASKHE